MSVEATWIITFASNILSLATLQFLLSLLQSLLRSDCKCSAVWPPVQSTLLSENEIKVFIFNYLTTADIIFFPSAFPFPVCKKVSVMITMISILPMTTVR